MNVATLPRKKGNAARAAPAQQRVARIHLVGTLRVTGPAGEDLLPRKPKTQAVFAYLCLAGGTRLPRSRVAGLVWDRSEEVQARDSLRQAMGEIARAGIGRVESDKETVRLDLASCWVDAFESPDRPDPLLDGLVGISSSFDRWLLGERARFENHWQNVLEGELNRLIADTAAPDLRAAAARRLLNFMPIHEGAGRALMTAFADLGDYSMAIREYERLRVVIDNSLKMRPADSTTALYDDIRKKARARPAQGRIEKTTPQGGVTPSQADPLQTARVALDFGPAIAVLPYHDLSGAPGYDRVAEGFTEDLSETLSRVPGLSVISRESAAAVGHRRRSSQEIGAALGVDFIISGSIRVFGERLRLVVQLADTETGRAVWQQRFDDNAGDVLDLQEKMADAVVRSVAPRLRLAQLNRTRSKHPDDQNAYDLFLRGQEAMHSPSRAMFDTAGALFEQAIARAPRYAAALAWLAYWHVMRVGQGWSPDPRFDSLEADRLAGLAAQSDGAEAMAYAVKGHAAGYLRKDFDEAFACFETALQLNPNSPRAWLWNAYADAWIGEGSGAVDKAKRAMALSPYDPMVCAYSGGASMAYLADRQYSRAIEFALRGIRENRAYSGAYRVLVTALTLAERLDEARAQVHRLLTLEPRFTVEQFQRRYPGSERPVGKLYADAFARAGVPLAD